MRWVADYFDGNPWLRVTGGPAATVYLEYRHFDGNANDYLCLVTDHALTARRVAFLNAVGVAVLVQRGNDFVSQGSPTVL